MRVSHNNNNKTHNFPLAEKDGDLTDFLFGGDNVTYIYTKENYRTLHACIRSKLKFANYVLIKGRGGFFNFSV